MSRPFDAVILAGGAARRLGGVDKPGLDIAGETLLERVLGACVAAGAAVLIVVGPERATARQVVWVREEPPGGGPVPALAAGIEVGSSLLVAVLAADLPFLDAEAIAALLAAQRQDADGVLYTDERGKDQPLVGVYRREALVTSLASIAEHEGARLRSVLENLDLVRLPDVRGAAVDCDTWERVDAARWLLATSPGSSEDGPHGQLS